MDTGTCFDAAGLAQLLAMTDLNLRPELD